MQAEENAKFPHENVLVRDTFSGRKDVGRNNPVVGAKIGQGSWSVDFGTNGLFRECRSFCAESFFFDFGGLTTRCHTSINALLDLDQRVVRPPFVFLRFGRRGQKAFSWRFSSFLFKMRKKLPIFAKNFINRNIVIQNK